MCEVSPVNDDKWWNQHCKSSSFTRSKITCTTAEFRNPSAKANIIVVTGWSETFLKYSELIRYLYEHGFSVFTYDHQSQGLSGRWLPEHQSTWVHSFDDYVDDFVYFVSMLSRENNLPFYCVAHSMGCLVSGIAVARHPAIVKRIVFSAPMFRNKCGMKALEYKMPLPQPLAYWITSLACYCGLGKMHALGFFKENPDDPILLKLTTDKTQLSFWRDLRIKYPRIISSCVTNDWVLHSLRAQQRFSNSYARMATNCLIFQASDDIFVYNHAIDAFAEQAPYVKQFTVPDSYHELLMEKDASRKAIYSMINAYFSQETDDVSKVKAISPVVESTSSSILTIPQLLFRGTGILVALTGVFFGMTMMVTGRRR